MSASRFVSPACILCIAHDGAHNRHNDVTNSVLIKAAILAMVTVQDYYNIGAEQIVLSVIVDLIFCSTGSGLVHYGLLAGCLPVISI